MKLMELLHNIQQENKSGLIDIDSWRYPDVDHLVTMGFEFGDDFHMHTTKEPKITVYKKKEIDEATGKKSSFFYVEEPKKKTRRFKEFNDVIDYFDTYEQPIYDKDR